MVYQYLGIPLVNLALFESSKKKFGVLFNMFKVFFSPKIRRTFEFRKKSWYLEHQKPPSNVLPVSWGGTCTQDDMMRVIEDGLARRRKTVESFRLE